MPGTSNIRNIDRIRINWPLVDRLMVESGVKNDAEIARRSGIPQSTIHHARKGAASLSTIGALKSVFPDASLDDLILVPLSPEVPGVLAS